MQKNENVFDARKSFKMINNDVRIQTVASLLFEAAVLS